jgi:hypothetical protein
MKNAVTKEVAYHLWSTGLTRSWPEPSALELTPGVWTDITPPGISLSGYGASSIAFAPSNRDILYASFDEQGIRKSLDRGATWFDPGTGTASAGPTTTRLDNPVCLTVNPEDPDHVVATQGVRGTSLGFWISHDGAATWTMPSAFSALAPTNDVTSLAVDPTDWHHMLIGFHSPWDDGPAGILETSDAGEENWTLHEPQPTWPIGTMAITILHHPTLDIGNSSTWMVHTDGDGIHRTTDSAASWSKVADYDMSHGMVNPAYYAPDGTLYAGGVGYPVRSTDNGVTWSQITDLAFNYYMGMGGDGQTIYTRVATPLIGGWGSGGFKVSTNGIDWVDQPAPGNQTFTNGPLCFTYDEVNNILYAAMLDGGLWALKPILD